MKPLSSLQNPYKLYPTICDLFQTVVTAHGNDIAILHQDRKVTYRELNNISNKLARYIQKACPNQIDESNTNIFVAICLDRTVEMIASILAVMKLGYGYVLIDPTYPRERLKHILQCAKVNIVVTHSGYAEKIYELDNYDGVVITNNDNNAINKESCSNIMHEFSPLKPAYIAFTSGTTGTPKGVQVSHNSLSYVVISYVKNLKLNHKSIVDFSSNAMFTGSALCFFPPLISGGVLVIQTANPLTHPSQYCKSILETNTNLIKISPAAFELLLPYFRKYIKKHHIKIVCSGERLLKKNIISAAKEMPWKIYNQYGFTECVAGLTIYEVDHIKLEQTNSQFVPVGIPYAGRKVVLRDADGNLVTKPMRPGILYANGEGFFSHYINSGAKQKTGTVSYQGEIFYDTGDLAQYNIHDDLEIIGRLDSQINLHGIRIELSDIENNILTHHEISNVFVCLINEDGVEKIYAYYTCRFNKITEQQLRDYLRAKIPMYMMPSMILCLEKFPYTKNGKIDRSLLPTSKSLLVNPIKVNTGGELSELQKTLHRIWSHVLKNTEINLNTSFYGLGGDSLAAYQLLIKINEEFSTKYEVDFVVDNTILLQEQLLKDRVEHNQACEMVLEEF